MLVLSEGALPEHSTMGNVQIFFFPTSKFILVLMNLTDTVVVNCILFN